MEIRKAVEADIPNLLPLMRELAEFENDQVSRCENGDSGVS
jgi:hypothetical protein